MTTPASFDLLEVRNLTKEFVIGEERMLALKDANLTVRKGEFICLIGA